MQGRRINLLICLLRCVDSIERRQHAWLGGVSGAAKGRSRGLLRVELRVMRASSGRSPTATSLTTKKMRRPCPCPDVALVRLRRWVCPKIVVLGSLL